MGLDTYIYLFKFSRGPLRFLVFHRNSWIYLVSGLLGLFFIVKFLTDALDVLILASLVLSCVCWCLNVKSVDILNTRQLEDLNVVGRANRLLSF